MLVLRRRAGESIRIGDDIEIEVIEISRTRVKLGVNAPRSVPVTRRETAHLAAENQLASAFFSHRGQDGLADLVRQLKIVSGENAQEAPPQADM